MLEFKKDEVYAMHLADVLHHLELICHICKILMEIIEREEEKSV